MFFKANMRKRRASNKLLSGLTRFRPRGNDAARDNISKILSTRPSPIIDSRNKVILIWSAKSGCTFAVKWLFDHMGLLEEALAYHSWIHKFRVEKLYPSHAFESSVQDFAAAPELYRAVRIVRNPFKRAVSSYVHASCCGYEDVKLGHVLGRPVNKHSRVSFREFVRYLETIDLTRCNVHHRLQVHPLERHYMPGSRFVINLDHSMESLPKLERLLGLPQTDTGRYRESSHHTRTSLDTTDAFSGDVAFTLSHKSKGVIPDYRWFYDADLERRVYNLYAEDFLRYGFSTTLGR